MTVVVGALYVTGLSVTAARCDTSAGCCAVVVVATAVVAVWAATGQPVSTLCGHVACVCSGAEIVATAVIISSNDRARTGRE